MNLKTEAEIKEYIEVVTETILDRVPNQMKDVLYTNIEAVIRGTLNYAHPNIPVTCPVCDGSAQIHSHNSTCYECSRTPGKVPLLRRLEILGEAASPPMNSFRDQLSHLINYYSKENGSDTPDFILAQYLESTLMVFDETTRTREQWYGRNKTPIPSGNLNETAPIDPPVPAQP